MQKGKKVISKGVVKIDRNSGGDSWKKGAESKTRR